MVASIFLAVNFAANKSVGIERAISNYLHFRSLSSLYFWRVYIPYQSAIASVALATTKCAASWPEANTDISVADRFSSILLLPV